MDNKEPVEPLWHNYPQELPPKDGYYRIEGLFGLGEKKKEMTSVSWYSTSKTRFAAEVGSTGNAILRWAER